MSSNPAIPRAQITLEAYDLLRNNPAWQDFERRLEAMLQDDHRALERADLEVVQKLQGRIEMLRIVAGLRTRAMRELAG